MAVGIGSVLAYFGGTAAAGGAVAAGAGTAAAAGAGAAAAGTAAGAAVGGSALGAIGTAAATAAVTAGVGALLMPDAPKTKDMPGMPDAKAQEEAKKRSIAEQMARRGRASTIMTEPASNKLGG